MTPRAFVDILRSLAVGGTKGAGLRRRTEETSPPAVAENNGLGVLRITGDGCHDGMRSQIRT